MPRYYEDKEQDMRPCPGIREDLRDCLLQCACVSQEGKSVKQCLREGNCKALQVTFFECKRSLITEQDSEEGRGTEVTH